MKATGLPETVLSFLYFFKIYAQIINVNQGFARWKRVSNIARNLMINSAL
jgi:hypothetical protein